MRREKTAERTEFPSKKDEENEGTSNGRRKKITSRKVA